MVRSEMVKSGIVKSGNDVRYASRVTIIVIKKGDN